MEVKVTLKPGQNRTKHLVEQYGDQLICVRYRYDKVKRKRYKTVELIIDEQAWLEGYRMLPHVVPRREPIGSVLVKLNYHEVKLRNAAKEAGGQWCPKEKAWKLPYDTAIALGLDRLSSPDAGRVAVRGRVQRSVRRLKLGLATSN